MKLGLRADDVLLRYDDTNLTDGFAFLHGRALEPKAGPKKKLVVLRGEDLITLELTAEPLGCVLTTRVATAKEVAAARKVTPERVPVGAVSKLGSSEAVGGSNRDPVQKAVPGTPYVTERKTLRGGQDGVTAGARSCLLCLGCPSHDPVSARARNRVRGVSRDSIGHFSAMLRFRGSPRGINPLGLPSLELGKILALREQEQIVLSQGGQLFRLRNMEVYDLLPDVCPLKEA